MLGKYFKNEKNRKYFIVHQLPKIGPEKPEPFINKNLWYGGLRNTGKIKSVNTREVSLRKPPYLLRFFGPLLFTPNFVSIRLYVYLLRFL